MPNDPARHQKRDDAVDGLKSSPASKGSRPTVPFEILGRWARDLGLSWMDVMLALRVPRNSAWRIMRGKAGDEWAEPIEEHLASVAASKGEARNPAKQYREWLKVGMRLAKDQPEHFAGVLSIVRHHLSLLPAAREEPFMFTVRVRKKRSKK